MRPQTDQSYSQKRRRFETSAPTARQEPVRNNNGPTFNPTTLATSAYHNDPPQPNSSTSPANGVPPHNRTASANAYRSTPLTNNNNSGIPTSAPPVSSGAPWLPPGFIERSQGSSLPTMADIIGRSANSNTTLAQNYSPFDPSTASHPHMLTNPYNPTYSSIRSSLVAPDASSPGPPLPFLNQPFCPQSQAQKQSEAVPLAPRTQLSRRIPYSPSYSYYQSTLNPPATPSRPLFSRSSQNRRNAQPSLANGASSPLFHPGQQSPTIRTSHSRAPTYVNTPNGNPRTSRNGTSDPHYLSVGDIRPVKDALALLRDGSPILIALAQTIVQTGRLGVPRQLQRDKILAFKGFQQSQNISPKWLVTLSKNDLDILAWIFVVSKHGRKDDVAKRIISSLKAPLKSRTPSPSKKPSIPARADTRWDPGSANSYVQKTSMLSSPRARVNMPSLNLQPTANAAGSNLNTQGMLRSVQHLATANTRRAENILQSRANQMHSLCNEALAGYTFDVGENPFNKPINAPLGCPQYVVFSSGQLSREGNDRVLRFATPCKIDAATRPEASKGSVQVHLRCLRVEFEKPKSSWQQSWPFPATCRVNGVSVELDQAQRYTNGKLAGRDSATDITKFLRRYKPAGQNTQNTVVLRRQMNNATASAGQFVLFAQEVLVLSHDTLTESVFDASEKYWKEYKQKLVEKGIITADTSKFEMARKGVMHFLTDPDGLTVSSMKVSLRCPLALTRIKTPVKGRHCQHVQCFDLDSFLQYARKSSKFDCPVCNKPTAQPSMLVISPYIEHALEKHEECDEIEIFEDGRMVQVERKINGVASDEEDEGGSTACDAKTDARRPRPAASKASCVVVDLTLESDDETPPPMSSLPASRQAQSEGLVGNSGQANNNVARSSDDNGDNAQVDQDVMFTFRSYDYIWGHQNSPDLENGSHLPPLPSDNGNREQWSCDVIALDSD